VQPERQFRVPAPAGPTDAWLLPRLGMSFRPALMPIRDPVAKLGGQPVWLDEPFWPISWSFRTPMTFVGQFPIPGPELRMTYLFVTHDELATAETYDPEGGENALVVQPGGRIPPFLTGSATADGPSLWRHGATWAETVPVEFHVDLSPPSEADARAIDEEITWDDSLRDGMYRDPPKHDRIPLRSYIGGRPLFWQTDVGVTDAWRFFFQLDGGEGWGDEPYSLNFGGGTGYAFLSPDENEGRFYWDR
jgi:hypothetical protein